MYTQKMYNCTINFNQILMHSTNYTFEQWLLMARKKKIQIIKEKQKTSIDQLDDSQNITMNTVMSSSTEKYNVAITNYGKHQIYNQ